MQSNKLQQPFGKCSFFQKLKFKSYKIYVFKKDLLQSIGLT